MMASATTAPVLLCLLLRPTAALVCDDGTTTVPDAWLDDDYCDCADGSDEPNTGACPGTIFLCPCKPHKPVEVFASRVNDGVCDCCDGSDENKSGGGCPNTCVELASEDLVQQSRSALQRAEREKTGRAAAATRAEKLAQARAALAGAKPKLDAARSAKIEAETAEEARRADRERRLAAGEVAAALKMDALSPTLLRAALARVVISLQVSGADALHDQLSASSLSEAMEDVDSADLIEVAMEAKDASRAYDADGYQSDGAQGAPQACRDAADACGFEVDLLKLLPLETMPIEELQTLVRDFAQAHGQVALLAQVSAALLRGAGVSLDEAAVDAALSLLEPFHDADADAARASLKALESAASNDDQTVAELEPVEALNSDFGDAHEWHALHSQCYTAKHGAFEYRLCPFDTFAQDGRSLGKYEGWRQVQPWEKPVDGRVAKAPLTAREADSIGMHPREMVFGDGEMCADKPRSARVLFKCADEDGLLGVVEPETCAYVAIFGTPSACTTDSVRAAHAELAAAAAAAGLPYEPDAAVKTLLGL